MVQKSCRICGATKPLTEFHRAKDMRDGHRNECKVCFRERSKARYAANPEKYIAGVKRWQQQNRERVSA